MTETQQQSSITVNQLASLVNGIILAQKRGAYTLEESAALLEPVTTVIAFINAINKQEATNSEKDNSDNTNTANDIDM